MITKMTITHILAENNKRRNNYITLRAGDKRLRKEPIAAENSIDPVLAAKSPRVIHGKGPRVPPWQNMTKSFIKIPLQKSEKFFPKSKFLLKI